MRARIKEDDFTVPSPDGPYAYAHRAITHGAEHPLIVRTRRDGGDETVLLDGNALPRARPISASAAPPTAPTTAPRLCLRRRWVGILTLSASATSQTGEDLADVIPATTGGAVWVDRRRARSSTSGSTTTTARPRSSATRSAPTRRTTCSSTRTRSRLLHRRRQDPVATASSSSTATTTRPRKSRLIPTPTRPTSAPRLIAQRDARRRSTRLDHSGDRFFILTNAGGAEDFKIVTAPVATPGPARTGATSCRTSRGRLILDITAYTDFLVRLERESGLPRIVIRHLADGERARRSPSTRRPIRSAWSAATSSTPTTLRFTYSSMTTPARVYDYDMATRDADAPQGAGGSVRPRSRRLRHPPHLRHRRRTARRCRSRSSTASDTPLDGSAPCLLYGYGAYGIAMPASFSHHAAVAGRPRLRLCHRPYPRRQGQGLSLVRRREAREEAQHLHRLHRRRPSTWSPKRFTSRRPHRRLGRLGRRHADRRRRQHGARSVRRPHRRGALRRRAQHHARRHAAADAAGMAGMGQPDRQRSRLTGRSPPTRPTTMSARTPIRRSWRSPA